jgi:hypothetical protein
MSKLTRLLLSVKARTTPKTLIRTANSTITAADALYGGCIVSNKGAAGAIIFNLPPALPGMRVGAIVQAAQLLAIDPNGTEIILGIAGVSLGAGVIIQANALGECIELVCLEKGIWSVISYVGVWTATGA